MIRTAETEPGVAAGFFLSLLLGVAAVGAIHVLSQGAWLPGRRAAAITAVVPYGKLLFPLAVIPLSAGLPLAYLVATGGPQPRPRPWRVLLVTAGTALACVLLVLLYQRGYLLNGLLVAVFLHDRLRGVNYTRAAVAVLAVLVLLGGLRPLASSLAAAVTGARPGGSGAGQQVEETASGEAREARPGPGPVRDVLMGPVRSVLLHGANFDHADVWPVALDYAGQQGWLRGATLAAIPARFLTPPARQQTGFRTAVDRLNEHYWKHFYWQTRFGFNVTLPQELYLNFGAWPLPAAGVLPGLLTALCDRWLWRRRRLGVAFVYAAAAAFAAGGFVKEPGAVLQWSLAYVLVGAGVEAVAGRLGRTAGPGGRGNGVRIWTRDRRRGRAPASRAPLPGVVILRGNPVAPDPRVERVARTLAREGFKVTVVGWDREGRFPELELAPYGPVVRLRARGRYGAGPRNLPALLRWQLQLVYWLLFHRRHYSIIHACDFDTLLPALLMKLVLGKGVVYDIFDWYADTVRGLPGCLRRGLARLDAWLLQWADAVILADENRLAQLGTAHPRRLEIVYNSPDWDPKGVIRGLPSRRGLRVAYIGLLQADRGLLELIDVMSRHPEWELDLGGFGAEEERIRQAAAALPNARFHARVPYHRCLEVYARADVLVATYDPSVPNYRFSSPNKLFEAMRLGKPIVVAEGTGVDQLVKAWRLGYVVPYGDTGVLEAALQDAAGWAAEERRAFAVRVRRLYDQQFSWRLMEERLLRVYGELITSIAAVARSQEPGSPPDGPDHGGAPKEPQEGWPPE